MYINSMKRRHEAESPKKRIRKMEGHYDYINHLFDDIEDITYEEKYDDEIDIPALDYNEDEIEDIIKSIKM